jgi:two-component system phosphate regulon response regulator OmpR
MHPILLIDDDRAMAALLTSLLAQHGFAVTSAPTAAEGLRALGGDTELLLIDLELPDEDGFSLIRRLRDQGERRPIVALSERGEDPHCIRALNVGADDYVIKPFNYLVLAARLEAALRRSTREAGAAPAQDGLDADQRVLRLGGRAVPLTATEFRVVAALVERAGRVLSRAELGALIDEEGGAPDLDRLIDQHVSRLRAKLEPEPKAPRHLITERGVGYRFAW